LGRCIPDSGKFLIASKTIFSDPQKVFPNSVQCLTRIKTNLIDEAKSSLLVYVMTSPMPEDIEMRDVIRQSWGKLAAEQGISVSIEGITEV
jgi:hypothetical protein